MPRKMTECRNCGHIEAILYDDDEYEECSYCGSTLKTETVYTEEEFQEAIGEYANTKLYQEGYRSGKKEVENLISTVRDLIEEAGNQLYVDQDGIGSIPEARRLIEKTLEMIDEL